MLSQDKDAVLRQWEIAGPEVVGYLMNIKKYHHIGPEIYIGKHFEDYSAFEKTFFTDGNNLFNCFKDVCNLFKEDEIIVFDTGEVMTPEIQSCLCNLLEINEDFVNTE